MRVFVDTNVWVYRFDRREPEKSSLIRDWLRNLAFDHEIVISTQVLIEFRSVLSRKLKPAMSGEAIHEALKVLAQFEVVPANSNLVIDAHKLAQAAKLSWFDALIVEAAIRSGCGTLYTEDLTHGQRFGKLSVVNPLAM